MDVWKLGKIIKAGAAVIAAVLATTLSPEAIASTDPMKPDAFTASPGGVDLRTGRYISSQTEFTIGDPARGGFVFRRSTMNPNRTHIDWMAQFSHNWKIYVLQQPENSSGTTFVSIVAEGLASTFGGDIGHTYSTGAFTQSSSGPRGILHASALIGNYYYVYTAPGGEQITFRNINSTDPVGDYGAAAYASEVRYPNGIIYTLNYDTSKRLTNIVSNAGYALVFEYTTVGSTSFVAKACGINLTQQAVPSTCPSGVPTVSYGYTGSYMNAITDVSGNVWTISQSIVGYQLNEKFFRPGEATPYLTNVYDGNPSTALDTNPWIMNNQTFADGHQYSYQWNSYYYDTGTDNYMVYGSGYTENGTLNTSVSFSIYDTVDHVHAPIISTGPEAVTDPLGRTTSYYYCVSCADQKLYWKQLPSGMRLTNHYDGNNNIDGRTVTPNSGSSLASIVTSASFDCSTMTNCNKPTYSIDAKGNRTDYTYDPTHGGVLTESAPADASGVRAVKRYAYAQRYAWIKSGSSYVQAASPIWVMTEMRTCRTSATVSGSCSAGTSDEVLTTYEYGPNSGPNNLLPRGIAVTADGQTLRTCYAYDAVGRKISETKPAAGLTVCS
ncbi:MAG: hypothetical protein J0I47_15660 [Sphingomonas sp.]|uniref:hypothetical protein n=1 Tax=Sphingomonas sp. TaxID=28214 RepID=UPI001ACAB32C|nr:hypothetical protein [Sphingomonas sp.]MBN8809654.1 hypothetical protein [Sphingomonas sp.]